MSRDRTVEDTFYLAFTTRAFATGIPTILAGSPVISAYEDVGLTQITAGLTLGVDHDGITGLNMITIAATGANGFESGKDYQLVITTGTVGGVSVVGEVIGQFSLGLSAAAVDLANATDGLTVLKASLDDIPTVAEFEARSLLAASYFDPAADAVANVTLVATTTTNTDMVGTDGANTVVPPSVAQFDARTLVAASYFDPAADAVANVTLVGTTTDVTNQVTADVTAISGDATAADNLESMYDGTGYIDDTAPASRAQVGSLSSGSAAISVQASSYTLTTGTQSSGTISDSETLNGVYHEHTDTAGSTDLYYEFDVGGSGVGVDVLINARMNSNNDSVGIYAYDWANTQWDQIDTLDGTNGSFDQLLEPALLVRHTGSGANLGKVRVRFYAASGLSTSTLRVDRIATAYAVISNSIGYADGAVWVDTTNGVAGTETFVNGVADNPCLTWADAQTLATALGIHHFRIVNGSSITLDNDSSNFTINGHNFGIALGGQVISGVAIIGANNVTGTGTDGGAVPRFEACLMGTVTLPPCELLQCCLTGDITANAVGDFFFTRCHSLVAGASTPSFDFGAVLGNVNLSMPGYAQGIELKNFNATGTDLFSISGQGQIVYAATCSGTVNQRGEWKVTNTGGVTITADDNTTNIAATLVDTGTTIPATLGSPAGASISADIADIPTVAEFEARTLVSAGYFDPAADAVANVTLVATTTDVTNQVTADVTAISGDSTAADNLEASLETLVLGTATGTPTTTTMPDSALTEATNDHYNGRIIIWRTGVLTGQATDITGYNGTTKTFTFTATTDAASASDAYVIV